jgi:hypothetical protein
VRLETEPFLSVTSSSRIFGSMFCSPVPFVLLWIMV